MGFSSGSFGIFMRTLYGGAKFDFFNLDTTLN